MASSAAESDVAARAVSSCATSVSENANVTANAPVTRNLNARPPTVINRIPSLHLSIEPLPLAL
jgi:hypothetical protein